MHLPSTTKGKASNNGDLAPLNERFFSLHTKKPANSIKLRAFFDSLAKIIFSAWLLLFQPRHTFHQFLVDNDH